MDMVPAFYSMKYETIKVQMTIFLFSDPISN